MKLPTGHDLCYNSAVKTHGISAAVRPLPSLGSQARSGPTSPEASQDAPSDSYSAALPATPAAEAEAPSRSSEAQSSNGENKRVGSDESTSVSDSPTLLTVLQEAPPQDTLAEPETSLATVIRSAGRAVSQGVRRMLVGDPLQPFRAELQAINDFSRQAAVLTTPQQFAAKTSDFKARLAAGESLEALRPEVYAVAREAAAQAIGMRPFDCQVLGALAMDDGHIAEMRTGEGKTLTAVLPLYLNALAGRGAHLVTVNETLAHRDSESMAPVFERLGLTVGFAPEKATLAEKRAAYNCDVTYLSDRALGFDFLRDRGVMDPAHRVQRGHHFALIDEVDEVLIDEARTPLILSGKGERPSTDYALFSQIVRGLIPGDDYRLDEAENTVWLTDGGQRYVENELLLQESRDSLSAVADPTSSEALAIQRTLASATRLRACIRQENAAQKAFDDLDSRKPHFVARGLGLHGAYDAAAADRSQSALDAARASREQLQGGIVGINLYQQENLHRVHYLDASLKAHALYSQGKDYTVENGDLKIVDQNKGRVSEGKRFSSGLHQALEAKEGLPVKAETRTVSKISMPELIAEYQRKSGMTGTGKTSESEFLEFYGLDVIEIPSNKPLQRVDHGDRVFASKEAKFQKVVEEAMSAAEKGRPVLVGTVSVNANRDVAARLLRAGWPADRLQILNAESVRGGEEYRDPNAGRSGTITLTTGERDRSLQHDRVNYKKLALLAGQLAAEGRSVLIDAETAKDAEELQAWLAGTVPLSVGDQPDAQAVGVRIRVSDPSQPSRSVPTGSAHLQAKDFAIIGPARFQWSEQNSDEILPQVLQAFSDGQPVVLDILASGQLGRAAEALLDRGLGLDAIPMLCEGKEKENAMIELAGRSGVITVATNMAGRGANIKPDLVAAPQIAEAAYQQASLGQAVTISVRKLAQATKIQHLLGDFVPTTISESIDHQPRSGQVLIKVESDPGAVGPESCLRGDDFKTGGLYVIGTERAQSRRVDDQLIGRAGRQGAEGDSQFFLSLEDDLPRIFGGAQYQPLLSMFGSAQDGVASPIVNSLMDRAQAKVENLNFDQRHRSLGFERVDRMQRETFYELRESVLLGDIDPRTLAASCGAQAADLPSSHASLKRSLLEQIDQVWQEHLESMDALRDGVSLESYSGRKPEEIYAERGLQSFEAMLAELKSRIAGRQTASAPQ